MNRLTLELEDKSLWFKHAEATDDGILVFVPTAKPPPAGVGVEVDVRFKGGCRIFLAGTVLWRRGKSASGMPSGAGIVIKDGHAPRVAFIHGYVRGGLVDRRAGQKRIPAKLQVVYRAGNAMRVNFTRDLSRSGICLNCAQPVPLEDMLDLRVIFPMNIGTHHVQGKVIRHIHDDMGTAMAVQLRSNDPKLNLIGYHQALDKLTKALTEGTLPIDVLT